MFFTSDTHFGHANIIKYCERPFADIQEMDEALISNWNRAVGKTDLVFHLGDFCFGKTEADFQKYFCRLNGRVVFIKGNHDKLAWDCRYHFLASKDTYCEEEINGQDIVLCHYAMRVWNKSHYGSWHLFGHSHGTLRDDPQSLSIDVGVDCHGFAPLEFSQIKQIMSKKTFQPVDRKLRQAGGGIGLTRTEFMKLTSGDLH